MERVGRASRGFVTAWAWGLLAAGGCVVGEVDGDLNLRDVPATQADETAASVEVLDLADDRFGGGWVRRGVWEPMAFIDAGHPGLYLAEPHDPTRTPAILVHGLGGGPRQFATLADTLRPRGYQPVFYYYPTSLRLGEVGAHLYESLVRWSRGHGADRLVVVAHSMGGLVAWEALRRANHGGLDLPAVHLVTLSTPYGGDRAAGIAVERRPPLLLPVWIDLAEDSAFLRAVYRTPLPEGVTFDLVFGYRRDPGLVEFGGRSGDGAVTLDRLLHPELQRKARRVRGVDASHAGLLREPEAIDTVVELLESRPSLTQPALVPETPNP
ncbi:MAG: alpha/beta fold hydrolase [Planctomycetota bacterium]